MAAKKGGVINNPISHCPRGQGGRTFSRIKPGAKKFAGSESQKWRGQTPGPKNKRERFPVADPYYDWLNDPDDLAAALAVFYKQNK